MHAVQTARNEEVLGASELTHLDVRNQNSPDFRYDKFLFLGYVSPIGYTYGDAEVYTNLEAQDMRHYHNIEEVLPNCILDYNIEKVQSDWIRRLPKWQRANFILLQKEGNLYGKNLRKLITLVRKETRRSQNQSSSSSAQNETCNQELLKLEVEEQRVIDALQRVGAEARPTLVDFLLEPPRKEFLVNMLFDDSHEDPHVPTKSPDEALYRVLVEERARQVKPCVPIVAKNMHLLTELQVLDNQASLRKRPSRTQQVLLRPSRTVVDAVQRVRRVDQYSKSHGMVKQIFGSPKIFSRRKQPKVPDILRNYPVVTEEPERAVLRTPPSPIILEDVSPVSSDCSIKSDIAGDAGNIWIEIDDKHKETFSVAEAWHAHVLNPHTALHTSHRARVTVRRAMRRFLKNKPLLASDKRF
ncbi:hypothetical protein RvY_07512-2 [Ramazzottius varieornatus]|uniref:Uncharacterized protein n=1 Tax=Ramazzottius varieornatus TaxID=947166 RepID=A0A1D1VAW7_RAMVA|nr:hypothetical protein RvY_07512-2 [Ramazzottius varieornatus]